MSPLLFLLIGLVAGVLSGMFGIGGGVVIVPALVLLARLSPEAATGTSLALLLLPVGLLGAMRYWQSGHVRVEAAPGSPPGSRLAWGGAVLALSLDARQLQRAFAVFLVAVAVHLWMST
ncbi:MAG: sulfite exporter TauE/SafE family protein [Gemmatimonadetes bacterium]|nr:sulfite exporter TauE/SafE family protein [Gemmatimonadota bacterium]